jgi:hypothetical protein
LKITKRNLKITKKKFEINKKISKDNKIFKLLKITKKYSKIKEMGNHQREIER